MTRMHSVGTHSFILVRGAGLLHVRAIVQTLNARACSTVTAFSCSQCMQLFEVHLVVYSANVTPKNVSYVMSLFSSNGQYTQTCQQLHPTDSNR